MPRLKDFPAPLPKYLWTFPKWPFGDVLCTMSAYGRIFLHVGALLSLLAVTIDRYLAIAYPLRYPTFMTCKAAIRATLVLWLISALFGCIYGPILGRPSAYFPLYSSCAFARCNGLFCDNLLYRFHDSTLCNHYSPLHADLPNRESTPEVQGRSTSLSS